MILPRMVSRVVSPVYLGALLGCLSLFLFHLLDGFRTTTVDDLDGRLILGIHEHWVGVFSGRADWTDMRIFWPLERTLGFSDTFFLTALPYSAFRFVGMDPYVSFSLMEFFLMLVGYVSCYALVRRTLDAAPGKAAFLAFLFVSTSLIHNAFAHSHPQLLVIWLIPIFLWGILLSIKAGKLAWIVAPLAGGWLGLLFLTAYYVSWYFVFFCGVLGVVFLIFWLVGLIDVRDFLRADRRWIRLILLGVGFGVGLIPFLYLYLPVHSQYGVAREWGETALTVPSIREFFNQGDYNWMWSGLRGFLGLVPEKWPQARSMGFGPFLFGLFVFGSVFVLRGARNVDGERKPGAVFVAAVVIATWVCLLLNFRIGDFTLWRYVYQSVPGASAMTFFHRFNFVLILPILWIIGHTLNGVKPDTPVRRYLLGILLLLVVLEQQPARISDYHQNYQKMLTRIDHVMPPPEDARVFYIRRSVSGEKWQHAQLDAMQVAQKFNLATVNGYSGLYPKDWWLYGVSEDWYPKEVIRWIHLNGAVPDGLYQLNWDTGQWTAIPAK